MSSVREKIGHSSRNKKLEFHLCANPEKKTFNSRNWTSISRTIIGNRSHKWHKIHLFSSLCEATCSKSSPILCSTSHHKKLREASYREISSQCAPKISKCLRLPRIFMSHNDNKLFLISSDIMRVAQLFPLSAAFHPSKRFFVSHSFSISILICEKLGTEKLCCLSTFLHFFDFSFFVNWNHVSLTSKLPPDSSDISKGSPATTN